MKRYISVAIFSSLLTISGLASADIAPKLIHPAPGVTHQHVSSTNPGCGTRTPNPVAVRAATPSASTSKPAVRK